MTVKDFFIGFKSGFQLFGKTVSGIVNVVLLSLVYFVGVGLTSIFCKIGGKKFLELKIDKDKKSYWEESESKNKSKESYSRMF